MRLKYLIFILLLVPNLAFAQGDSTVRRTIVEEGDDSQQQTSTVLSKKEQTNEVYGLAAVVLAVVAILAFNSLMKDRRHTIKKKK